MARTINERADELFMLQSAPCNTGELALTYLEEFLKGTLDTYNFTSLLGMSAPVLRPHLFQEMRLSSANTSEISEIRRYAFAELGAPSDTTLSPLSTLDLSKCTYIGPYAFWQSPYITTLKNTNNVTTIGSEKTDEVDITDEDGNITKVYPYGTKPDGAIYSYCENDTPGHVFEGTGITSLSFPSVTNVPDFTFTGMPEVTTITLSKEDVTVGSSAFSNCPNLTTVTGKITYLGDGAFRNDTELVDAQFSKCDFVGYECFYGCSNLKNVKFGTSELIVEQYAFADNTNLVKAILNSLSEIGSNAFDGCTKLAYVKLNIPNSENDFQLPYKLFNNCTGLRELYFYTFAKVKKQDNSLPDASYFVNEDGTPKTDEEGNQLLVIYVDTQELLDYYTQEDSTFEWYPYRSLFKIAEDAVLIEEDTTSGEIGITTEDYTGIKIN